MTSLAGQALSGEGKGEGGGGGGGGARAVGSHLLWVSTGCTYHFFPLLILAQPLLQTPDSQTLATNPRRAPPDVH